MLRPGIARFAGEIHRALESVEAEHDAADRDRGQHRGKLNACGPPCAPIEKFPGWKPLAISAMAGRRGHDSLNTVIAEFVCAKSFTLQKLTRK